MYILSLIYFFYLNILALLNTRYKTKIISIFVIVFFVLLNFYLSNNIYYYSKDYSNYIDWFDLIFYSSFFDNLVGKDPGFKLLVSFIQLLFGNNYTYIYFVFMMIIFILKYNFAKNIFYKSSLIFFLWILFCSTYILHDLTQIRAGLAIALSSYMVIRIIYEDSSFIRWSLLLLSILIHQSIIVLTICFSILYIFRFFLINRLYILIFLIIGLIANLIFQEKLSSIINIYLIDNERAENYLNGVENLSSVSLTSFFFLSKILVILILLYYWSCLSNAKKIIVSLSSVGCFFYMFFMFNGVFAVRVSELFILFSLATFIFPLEIKLIDINIRFLWCLTLLVMSCVFLYSSNGILIG